MIQTWTGDGRTPGHHWTPQRTCRIGVAGTEPMVGVYPLSHQVPQQLLARYRAPGLELYRDLSLIQRPAWRCG